MRATLQEAINEIARRIDGLTEAVNAHTYQLRNNSMRIAELQREVAILKGKKR